MIEVDLTGAFDEMLAKMQGDDWRAKTNSVFHATPKELGEAAVKQAISGDRNADVTDSV